MARRHKKIPNPADKLPPPQRFDSSFSLSVLAACATNQNRYAVTYFRDKYADEDNAVEYVANARWLVRVLLRQNVSDSRQLQFA